MSDTIKILGQSKPLAATLTDAYTVPAATMASVSSVVVCNQSATATTFRISLAVAGAVDTAAQYLYYDVAAPGNDTFVATIGISLAATDVLRVYNTLATCSFTVLGVQVT